MKTVKFKKWVITAIVSFIATIVLLILSVVVGGTSLLHSISRMDSIMATNTMHNMADIMHLDSDCFSGSITIEDGKLESDFNEECNEVYNTSSFNSERQTIRNDLEQIDSSNITMNKKNLNTYLNSVTDYAQSVSYTQSRIIEEAVRIVEDTFDTLSDADQEAYENQYLDGSDVDDYAEQYLKQILY